MITIDDRHLFKRVMLKEIRFLTNLRMDSLSPGELASLGATRALNGVLSGFDERKSLIDDDMVRNISTVNLLDKKEQGLLPLPGQKTWYNCGQRVWLATSYI